LRKPEPAVPLAGEEHKQQRLRWEEDERRRKRLADLEPRMDAIRKKENKAVEIHFLQLEKLRRANELRDFIETAKSLFYRDHGWFPEEDSPEDLSLRWAEHHADQLDPLGEGFGP
jgi:hypothetical protein